MNNSSAKKLRPSSLTPCAVLLQKLQYFDSSHEHGHTVLSPFRWHILAAFIYSHDWPTLPQRALTGLVTAQTQLNSAVNVSSDEMWQRGEVLVTGASSGKLM
jgi:hypothetical protein